MIRKVLSVLTALVLLLGMSACFSNNENSGNVSSGLLPENVEISNADISEMDFSFSGRDTDGTYTSVNAIVEFRGSSANINGSGAEVNDSAVVIKMGGTYVFSGSAVDMMISVVAGVDDKVQLVLDNVNIINGIGPAVLIHEADKVFITTASGSENTLADGSDYSVITPNGTTVDAAVFSRADLSFNGQGHLFVAGNYKHGVVSKDDLIIGGGSIKVQAEKIGLCGKDCVKIGGGKLEVSANTDGMRSENDEEFDKGFVYIRDGELNITAGGDGIQAANVIKIDSGDINISSANNSAITSSSDSMKGLKAISDIIINGGNIDIATNDDAIHSNNTVSIADGKLNLQSNDDGIHADTDLAASGGEIIISKSYEGLEAARIVISGGKLNVSAADDGLNAAGGNDSSGMGGRPGQGNFSSSVGSIYISGGYVFVDASGDGIDSNGTITISGGITLVSGPTNNGNGALDYDISADVSGGTFIALGSAGMACGFTSAENQGAIYSSFSSQSGGTNIALMDSEGNVVASFTPQKQYQSAVISAKGIQQNERYTLVVGGTPVNADANGYCESGSLSGGTTLLNIEMTSNIYGNSAGMGPGGMGPGGMGPGGGMPPQGKPPGRR